MAQPTPRPKHKTLWVKELPLYGRSKIDWQAIATKAKSKPGQWLMLDEKVNIGYGGQIRKGKPSAFQPAGSFEAYIRDSSRADGLGILFVRYIGEVDE